MPELNTNLRGRFSLFKNNGHVTCYILIITLYVKIKLYENLPPQAYMKYWQVQLNLMLATVFHECSTSDIQRLECLRISNPKLKLAQASLNLPHALCYLSIQTASGPLSQKGAGNTDVVGSYTPRALTDMQQEEEYSLLYQCIPQNIPVSQ